MSPRSRKARLPMTSAASPLSDAIGIQPGVAVPVGAPFNTIVFVPPLGEKKNYAVVVTDGVKDLAGNALRRSTLADILFTFQKPIVDEAGKSQIPGVSDADACVHGPESDQRAGPLR